MSDWPETPSVCSTPGVSRANLLDAGHHPLGPFDRGRIGQLHIEDQIAFVLLRDEAGRRVDELPIGQDQQDRRK